MAADIASSVALIVFFGILVISFVVWKFERDKEYKRRYAELNIGDKFFLLDTYNGNKCIITVTYVSPYKGNEYVIVESKGNEYKYSMHEFFKDVLLKTSRYYYEKLDPNTFKNVI